MSMFQLGIGLDVPVTRLESYQGSVLGCFVGAKPKAGHGDGVDCSNQSELHRIQEIAWKDL
jgi:hypothetical protein